ncbi:MAG: PIN domain-containing protein [Phycisphaerae bacterium]|nr:PIN domain-containing protein [Phycisphaerae bacterium]
MLARRMPFFIDSSHVWSLAERGRFRSQVSAISLTTVFYIVRKQVSAARAMRILHDIRATTAIVACDEAVIDRAIDAGFRDFEDAVQYFSALAGGADYLVTRNTVHFPHGELPIMTPAEFLAAIAER